MSDIREQFEKWYDDGKPDALPKDYKILGKNYLLMGWQAGYEAQQAEITRLNEVVKSFKLVGWHGATDCDAEYPIYTNVDYLGKNI